MSKPAVLIENLNRVYGRGETAVTALKNLNLQIGAGQFMAMKGRSGSGKTTLLNCLGGLDKPTSGKITIHDKVVSEMSEKDVTNWRKNEVGFVFQAFGLLPSLSAYENIELMLRITGLGYRARRDRAMACLEKVGLGPWSTHRPFELSGGQNQRVAIARAIANEPQLILADEATGELDTNTAVEILTLFKEIAKTESVTILLATHDHLVDEFVDQVLQLQDGQIVQ
ncbi:MAG: ABC transporter ATP-binding protein [Chloroflexota bacterium]